MTHTLHRRGDKETLRNDFVLLCMAAKGFNENGAAEKMREFMRIASRHNPVNIGDMKVGNTFRLSLEDIIERVSNTSIVHAVFTEPKPVIDVIKAFKVADTGLSLVLSSSFLAAKECSKRAGVNIHTVEYSLGIWGKIEKLPDQGILEITTMCGHAMIAPNLVMSIVEKIKTGTMEADEGSKVLGCMCECGIFNTARAKALLKRMVFSPDNVKVKDPADARVQG